MVYIPTKSSAEVVKIPKNQVPEGDLVLSLHSELTNRTFTFNVTDEGTSKRFYKFTLDLEHIPDGEYEYNINGGEEGLLRLGEVSDAAPETVSYSSSTEVKTYDTSFEVVQYRGDGDARFKLQEKDAEYTENGTYEIAPDPGYYGLSKVNVNVNSTGAMQSKYLDWNPGNLQRGASGNEYWHFSIVYPDSGYNGINKLPVFIRVDVQPVYDEGYAMAKMEPYSAMPLTFNILSAGTISWIGSYGKKITYSLNGGERTTITSTTAGEEIQVNAGDKLEFWCYNEQQYKGARFGGTATFTAEGNIGSIIYYGDLRYGSECYGLFSGCTGIVSAEHLVLLGDFTRTNSGSSYYGMFYNCTNLVTPPMIIPGKRAMKAMYRAMFRGCTSLTKAPVLQATEMAENCYRQMFYGCTSLTKAPYLDTDYLDKSCFNSMFYGCTSLTEAPVLSMGAMAEDAYTDMFNGCTNLSGVYCMAKNISANVYPRAWLKGVSPTGTFYKGKGVEWPSGVNGIPEGWTVQEINLGV